MNYYIIFNTEDRQVFVSKKEDLENINACVNMFEGIDRAPLFSSYDSAKREYDRLNECLAELKEDDRYYYSFFRLVPSYELLVEIRMEKGSLGTFSDVKIDGSDVTLTRCEEDEFDGDYTPRVYASIVDGVLCIAKEILIDDEYESRIVWASNRFTVNIKEAE